MKYDIIMPYRVWIAILIPVTQLVEHIYLPSSMCKPYNLQVTVTKSHTSTWIQYHGPNTSVFNVEFSQYSFVSR